MRFDDLCLHPNDRSALERFAGITGSGILLVAEEGFGKATIADSLARRITGDRDYDIETLTPSDSGSITIDQIRVLKKFFVLKSNDPSHVRVAVVHFADTMTVEAQNALLKLLEEPPVGCFFILTTSRQTRLLPTILSRLHTHLLTVPATNGLYMHLKRTGLPTEVSKIAGGLPGLTVSMAKGEKNDLVEAVKEAKDLLGSSTLVRLKHVDSLIKDKKKLEVFLQAMKIIASGAMVSLAMAGKPSKKWDTMSRSVLKAQSLLESNVSAKLVLTDLMLGI